jgi:uncharacterized membrane protein (UPF0182 family)
LTEWGRGNARWADRKADPPQSGEAAPNGENIAAMDSAGRILRGIPTPGRGNRAGADAAWSPSPATKRMVVTTLVILGLLAFIWLTSTFWIQWWWFESVGYATALTTRYISGALAFLIAALLVGGFFAANWRLALRRRESSSTSARVASSRVVRWPLWLLTLGVALFAGWLAALQWLTWRLAFAGNSFGVRDPIFGMDAAFYVFRLPALQLVHQAAIATVLLTLVAVAMIYLGLRGLDRFDRLQAAPQTRQHLIALAAALLLLFGLGYLIANWDLQYSDRGFAFGPGFTDVNVVRPLNYLLAVVSAAAAAVLVFGRRSDQLRWLAIVFGAWAIAVVVGLGVPRLVQQTIVEPNELQRESPYIVNNIALTRAGFGLDGVELRSLSGQGEPPAGALQADSPVLRNVRLWDYRIARETFRQLRSFVPYYVFFDVDVDRYPEEDEIQQVLVSARELDTDGLPANAQTWTNQHLSYTHGYGAVVSPINEATNQGLPVFTVGGIPPEPAGVMTIERPEIYFGELESTWVAVNTGVQEVNGIPGDTPPTRYEGLAHGSIALNNYLKRVMLAINLGDRRILFTDELTGESRVLLQRSIANRVRAIAPFLLLDSDAYLTVIDGRLMWIMDAYTATDRFPNSTPSAGVNYVRHTVKATVDAYDGTVTFYRTAVPDPIADAYADLFKDMFRPISEAPPVLAEHFRYPEDLFDLQTRVYSAYHVTDPTAFYNGEDRWEIATEQSERSGEGTERAQPMEPYYMTLPLPGETETGFKIIRPFTPINRPNMTAWMAGQSDARGSARLVVYRFPRQTTVFGPQQVEARINQDPQISEQFTLLSRSGSRVIRGNLLVIPVEETVMYVQPVYLQATDTAGAPTQLQFVIVATNEQVEMRPTLEEALAAIAGDDSAAGPDAGAVDVEDGALPGLDVPEASASDALEAFERGQRALADGDWAGYGEAQSELERILESLAGADETAPLPLEPTVVATPQP